MRWFGAINKSVPIRAATRLVPPRPQMVMGCSWLLDDLDRLGMVDNTVVFWLGDFGRTPKINSAAGRDHWVGSTVFTIGVGGFKIG